MQFALELFLIGKLAACRDDAVLRFQRRRIGADGLGLGGCSAALRRGARDALRGLRNLNAGDEALQVALLLRLEIASLRTRRVLAGTPVGALSGAGAVLRGLCVR
jgi:hypothetical protein